MLLVLLAAPGPGGATPEAVRLYDEGLRHFRAGEYDQAIHRLRQSYLEAPLPALLYDLGQAFRLKGDCAEALAFYRRFLATNPDGKRRERTVARIAEMERCADQGRLPAAPALPAAVDAPAKAGPQAAASEPPPLPGARVTSLALAGGPRQAANAGEPAPRQLRRRHAGIGAGIAALALASTSGVFAWRSATASDEVSGAFVPGANWTGDARAAERAGVLSERLAIATGVGALVAAGLATWLLWR